MLHRPKTVIVVLSGFAAVIVAVAMYRTTPTLVHDDLLSISQGRAPSAIFDKFDAVCFDGGSGRFDLTVAARQIGLNIEPSLNACGIDRTCCDFRSDVAGFIGLVRGTEVMCVEIDYFSYLLDGDKPFCAKPSQLKVSQQTYATRFNPPGRSYFTTVGRKYFQIGQRP